MDPQWIRIANAILAGAAFVLLAWRARPAWSSLAPAARLTLLALGALLFVGCVGSVEALNQNAPIGLRSYMAGAAYLWIIVGTTVAFHHEPRGPRR